MRQKKTPCICSICGKQFLGQSRHSKFCSQRCMYDDQNEKRRIKAYYKNVCQICGKVFETKQPKENTCSPECKRKRKVIQDKAYHERHKEEIKPKTKRYRETHQEQIIKYRKENKEHNYNVAKKWRQEVQHQYCKLEEQTEVENYELAKADNFVGWDRHHRLETHNSDGEKRLVSISKEELIALDMYYDRPSKELIWLKKAEHKALHQSCKWWGNGRVDNS